MNPSDHITLTGLRGFAYHGVLPAERREGQEFIVDVSLRLDTRRAAAGDDLTATVHYGQLAGDLHRVLTGEPVDLIETLAERLAAVVLERPAVTETTVRVHKPHAPIAVPFDDVVVEIVRDRLDAVSAQPVEVTLALGANLGDPLETLRHAVQALLTRADFNDVRIGPLLRTAPVGGPEQGDYLNTVIVARTTLAARQVLAVAHDLEQEAGRRRVVRWGPRTLDVDVIDYGGVVARSADLDLPHPRAWQRAFVLVPWAALEPGTTLPGDSGGPIDHLANHAPDRDGVRARAEHWLETEPDWHPCAVGGTP